MISLWSYLFHWSGQSFYKIVVQLSMLFSYLSSSFKWEWCYSSRFWLRPILVLYISSIIVLLFGGMPNACHTKLRLCGRYAVSISWKCHMTPSVGLLSLRRLPSSKFVYGDTIVRLCRHNNITYFCVHGSSLVIRSNPSCLWKLLSCPPVAVAGPFA